MHHEEHQTPRRVFVQVSATRLDFIMLRTAHRQHLAPPLSNHCLYRPIHRGSSCSRQLRSKHAVLTQRLGDPRRLCLPSHGHASQALRSAGLPAGPVWQHGAVDFFHLLCRVLHDHADVDKASHQRDNDHGLQAEYLDEYKTHCHHFRLYHI